MSEFAEPDEERDAIFTLLACAAVAKTWDPDPLGAASGHNIGAILVDKNSQPVFWARNRSTVARDLTEHAEVRLIRGYIATQPERTELHKHRIFTTLEPCAMCAGMIAMTNVARLVFGQSDPVYGGVFDRLNAGPAPYPKRVEASPASDTIASSLDRAFAASGKTEVIEWLPTVDAQNTFERLGAQFATLVPQFPDNAEVLENARAFLAGRVS